MSDETEQQVVRQLKLSTGEEIIGYVGKIDKHTIEFNYPLQILTHLDKGFYSFKPWWSTSNPLSQCILQVDHIVSSLIPEQTDINLYVDSLESMIKEYEEEEISDINPTEMVH